MWGAMLKLGSLLLFFNKIMDNSGGGSGIRTRDTVHRLALASSRCKTGAYCLMNGLMAHEYLFATPRFPKTHAFPAAILVNELNPSCF
jgi:hypothetical protein